MLGSTNFIMGIMNGAEIIIIVAIIGVLFLGAKKIPELARSFGRASSEYEKSRLEAKREMEQIRSKNRTMMTNVDREKLESIADTLGIDYSTKNDEELKASIETEINKSRIKSDNTSK
jgi:sec-independent protein translocase protein TatA